MVIVKWETNQAVNQTLVTILQNPRMNPHSEPKKQLNNYARYSGLAFQMFTIIGGAVWLGRSLDKYWELKFPVTTLILSLSSVILSMFFLIRSLTRQN